MQATFRRYGGIAGSSLLVVLALAFAATSCAGSVIQWDRPSDPLTGSIDQLIGSQWHLVMLNVHAPHSTSEPITLNFHAEHQAGGDSGCNLYGGSYTVTANTLTITDVVSTMRACADQELNDQEADYYQALQAVSAYELVNDQLILKDIHGSVVLVFTPA